MKKVFLKFPRFHRKTPVLESFSKVAHLFRTANLSKQKKTPTQVFFVKSVKFLRTPILKNICERLLLNFYFGKSHTG